MDSVFDAVELDTEAVAWLVRTENAGRGEAELPELAAWLEHPRNRAAYVRMRIAWSQADQLRRLQPLDGTVNPNLLSETLVSSLRDPQRSRASALKYILAAAALTALVSGVTAWVVAERML